MTIGVGLGMAEFPFSDLDRFWEWIGFIDEAGVNSFWQTDRMVSKQPFLECMSTMAVLAGCTKRLKFGMNVASAGIRDPLILAKQCATIDFLSKGRLLPAFGIGNIRAPVWTATGRPTKGRGQRTDEALDIIRDLWAGKEVTTKGTFFHYEGATISPLPVQKKFPFWIGGSSQAAINRTARIGTGWLAGRENPKQVAPVIAAIRESVTAAGRSIDDDHYGASFTFRFGKWSDPCVERAVKVYEERPGGPAQEYMAVGDADDIIRRFNEYIEAGVSKFVVRPIADDDADIMAQTKMLVDEVTPTVEGRVG